MESNKSKLILDLCGGTGAWSKPYRDNGYIVINVTLPKYDVRTYQPPENVYGILAAPPCTMFSTARSSTAKIPRNLKEGMEIIIACLNIIWQCQYKIQSDNQRKAPLKFWALENPKGLLEWFLGKPIFQFHPFEFGDPYKKKTCLWGLFNLPVKPLLINPIMPHKSLVKNLSSPMKFNRDFKKMAELRAITPQGFAKAFYLANQ